MKKAPTWLALVTGVMGIVTSWPGNTASASEAGGSAVRVLEAKDALSLIQRSKGDGKFVILDVRTAEEFASGHIGDAINIDYYATGFRESLKRLDRGKTYFVYCRTGRRSGAAVEAMESLGFTSIYRVSGDMVKWQSLNFPLVK